MKIDEGMTFKICCEVSKKVELDPCLLFAIVEVESNRRPEIISKSNAVGMMQIKKIAMEEVNRFYDKNFVQNDLKDPALNILIGGLYLKRWEITYTQRGFPQFVAIWFAILTYAWGWGNVQKWLSGVDCNAWIKSNVPQDKMEYNENVLWWFEYAKRKFTLESQKNNDSSKPAPKAISNELNSGA